MSYIYSFFQIYIIFGIYCCNSTSWHSQPYSKGSYTSIGVGGSQKDIVNLSLPVYADQNDALVRIKMLLSVIIYIFFFFFFFK